MSSKSKSSTSEASINKASSPATPRVSKWSSKGGAFKSDANTPSPLQKPRLSVDQSPKSVTSKPVSNRKAPKPSTTPDKQPTRILKGSELQTQLSAVQEDLKKAKEKLASSEKEKARANEEAKKAKRLADEANEKLREALAAQKRAQEDSEIEKFRVVEMEQAGIEIAQEKDDEWKREIESVRSQHALDLNALLSTTEELQRVKQELSMTTDAKNKALTDAADASKIVEIHAEKVEILTAELAQVKASMDSELEKEANEKNELISQLEKETKITEIHAEKMEVLTAELARVKASMDSELEKEANEKNELISQLEKETKITEIHAEKMEVFTAELARVKASMESKLEKEANEKNKLISQLEKETKITEIHAGKMEVLTAELARVKASMESKLEKEADEKDELISQLSSLRLELEKVKAYEEKLMDREDCIEQLNVELEAAKMAESYAKNLAEEWMKKAEAFEVSLEEANQRERSVSENLDLVTKKFDEKSSLLQNAESVTSSLIEKVGLLEVSASQQRKEIEESEHRLDLAKEEAAEMAKKIESLVSELEIVNEKNIEALNNEKATADSFQKLLEEKDKLVKELENSSDENERYKEAMESLTAALHEVSSEAREMKEKLLSSQAEKENYESEIENLKFSLKSSRDKYDELAGEAKLEIDILNKSIESSKHEYQSLKDELDKKELNFTDCVKQFEEESSSMEKEISRLTALLTEKEEKARLVEEKGALMENTLKEAETEVTHLKKALENAKDESTKSKESLVFKENEIQSLVLDNEQLREREAISLKKIEELSKLLEESILKKQNNENDEISDCEKDYDMLPKVVEFSVQNGDGKEEKTKIEDKEVEIDKNKLEILNGNKEDITRNEKEEASIEVDSKMWASCKIEENEFSTDKSIEQESFEEQINSETRENDESLPLEQQIQKKKKPLLKKFGSLLKKKPATNTQK